MCTVLYNKDWNRFISNTLWFVFVIGCVVLPYLRACAPVHILKKRSALSYTPLLPVHHVKYCVCKLHITRDLEISSIENGCILYAQIKP